MATLRWYGDSVIRDVRGTLRVRLERAAIEVKGYIKEKLSRGQPTRIPAESKAKYGTDPSKAGEYPKIVTSELRTSVDHEVDDTELRARVGTNVKHGLYLELGTRKMQRRPWLSRGVQEMQSRIKKILGGGG